MFGFLNPVKKIRVSYIPGEKNGTLCFNTLAILVPHGDYYEHSDGNTYASATMIYPNGTSIAFHLSTERLSYQQVDGDIISTRQETGWVLLGSQQINQTQAIHEFALKNNPSAGSVLIATAMVKDVYENPQDPTFLWVEIDTDGAVVKDQTALKQDAHTLAGSILESLLT